MDLSKHNSSSSYFSSSYCPLETEHLIYLHSRVLYASVHIIILIIITTIIIIN